MRIALIAQPWWVNLAILVPVAAYFWWRRSSIAITTSQLLLLGVFACAFGFLEATVVVYLRAASGLLPGYQGTRSDMIRAAPPVPATTELPESLVGLEVIREAATIFMLLSVALLTTARWKGRVAVFLWAFAIWDMVYYVSLWATVGWPHSFKDSDILFLIPEPWFAPVWFPLLVSALTLVAVLLTRTNPTKA